MTGFGWLTHPLATTPKRPPRFYFSVGRFEKKVDSTGSFITDMTEENERFRDVLKAKGYPVTHAAMNGAHHPLNWRSTLPNGLMTLAGPPGAAPQLASAITRRRLPRSEPHCSFAARGEKRGSL